MGSRISIFVLIGWLVLPEALNCFGKGVAVSDGVFRGTKDLDLRKMSPVDWHNLTSQGIMGSGGLFDSPGWGTKKNSSILTESQPFFRSPGVLFKDSHPFSLGERLIGLGSSEQELSFTVAKVYAQGSSARTTQRGKSGASKSSSAQNNPGNKGKRSVQSIKDREIAPTKKPNKKVKVHRCHNGKNPLCKILTTLNPKMTLDAGMALSNSFTSISKRYKLDPKLLIAIAFQESSLDLGRIRKVKGLRLDSNDDKTKVDNSRKVDVLGGDFCMMQIHWTNVIDRNLDVQRLLTDADYCLGAGAAILKEFEVREKKRKSPVNKEIPWWTYYHSSKEQVRQFYASCIQRHLSAIDETILRDEKKLKKDKVGAKNDKGGGSRFCWVKNGENRVCCSAN